jgi:hydrogenase nickel incorporation protein HypA/HybF
MHELSYVKQIYALTQKYSASNHARKVLKVFISVNVLSGIEPDPFRFYWDQLVKNTKLHGSKIVIKTLPVHVQCRTCSKQFIVRSPSDIFVRCKYCGSIKTVVTEETTIKLNSIMVDT